MRRGLPKLARHGRRGFSSLPAQQPTLVTTLGNQLGKSQICEPWLRERVLTDGVFEEDDLAPLPTPPDDPIVPPWGGHPPPPALNLRGN